MRRLLLRATKTATFGTRIDILFQNVHALKLPSHLNGLTVRLATDDEEESLLLESGAPISGGGVVYVVEGTRYSGYVIAGPVTVHEDKSEYDEESALLRPLNG
jgi:hypothetical protein